MSQIKAVGFDAGGVVLTSEQARFYRECSQVFGRSLETTKAVIQSHMPALERGDIEIDRFWQLVTGDLGVAFEPDRDIPLWTKHYIADSPVNAGLVELADKLRTNGYKVGLLSNTHEEHIQLNLGRGVFDHFDAALFSSRIKTRKPERAAYQALWEALNVKPAELVFIDNQPENVTAANQLGLKGIEYTNKDELVTQLKDIGIRGV